MIVDINGHILHYQDAGKGSPVVLLHGFLESLAMWKSFSAGLIKKHRVIAIDLPGHGNSAPMNASPSIDGMAELVYGVLESLHIEKCILIGHSMGGYVGLSLLEKHPQLMDKLILLHSKAAGDSPEGKIKRNQGMEMLRQHPLLFIKEAITNLFWSASIAQFKKEIAQLISDAQIGDYSGYIQALEAMKNRPDRREQLSLNKNVYLIAGKHDPVIPYETSLEEMALVQKNHTKSLLLSGHMGFIEEKENCEKFLNEIIASDAKHH
jgi:pimeloyl-ACP methyl ester carboxylesterase